MRPVGLIGNKRQKIYQLKQENKELRACLEALVDLYVANRGQGKKWEFICGITPPSAAIITNLQRARDKCWSLWDLARRLLGERFF